MLIDSSISWSSILSTQADHNVMSIDSSISWFTILSTQTDHNHENKHKIIILLFSIQTVPNIVLHKQQS